MAKLKDDQIVAICEAELQAASSDASGELASQRASALESYNGELYGDEVEGRSQVVTREVLETIEWIMPSLMRIFCDAQNLVEIEPVGEGDEDAAEQETDRINYAFWKENRGFYNLYAFCKDAMLSKNGVIKAWWDDDRKEEREEYKGINEFELLELMQDESVEREVLKAEQDENGINITFKTTDTEGQIRIEPCPPEEFGINRNARSPFIEDCTFVYHRSVKTFSDLIEAGYDRKLVEGLPYGDEIEHEESLARRNIEDEQSALRTAAHKSMRTIWVTECYIKLDKDDDGIAELLKVTLATGGSGWDTGSKMLEIEDVDAIPFFSASPIINTHKFHGTSIADLVMDLQRIRTTLLRGVLDNMYLANNQRMGANKNVNLDDLLTSRPGGIVRTKGETPPLANMSPIPHQPVPAETFMLWEGLEDIRKDRTGVGGEVAGLDKAALANVNTGVAALAYDAARMRIELIARIIAEMGLSPLFRRMHELLRKHSNKKKTLKLRDKWIEVNPSEWRTRQNLTVMVGMGQASQERRMMALSDILEKQQQATDAGGMGTLLSPENVHNALTDYTEALGLKAASRYWMDPANAEPPEPPGPDPQMLAIEAQKEISQAQMQVEMMKLQSSEKVKTAELQLKQMQMASNEQVDAIKADLKALELEAKASQGQAKMALEAEIKFREHELAAAEARAAEQNNHAKIESDMLKAVISAGTTLTVEQMRLLGMGTTKEIDAHVLDLSETKATLTQAQSEALAAQADATAAREGLKAANSAVDIMTDNVAALLERLQGMEAERNEPLSVMRGDDGLIMQIGNRRVERDEGGQIMELISAAPRPPDGVRYDLDANREALGQMSQYVDQLLSRIDGLEAEKNKQLSVVRDENGLISQVGDRMIQRDETGQVLSIG